MHIPGTGDCRRNGCRNSRSPMMILVGNSNMISHKENLNFNDLETYSCLEIGGEMLEC